MPVNRLEVAFDDTPPADVVQKCFKNFQPLRCGLISMTVIMRDSFKFDAVRICCEKHPKSRINLR